MNMTNRNEEMNSIPDRFKLEYVSNEMEETMKNISIPCLPHVIYRTSEEDKKTKK
jgi:hypothetical protein